MDLLYTHPNVKLRFYATDTQLIVDSDVAYLVALKTENQVVICI